MSNLRYLNVHILSTFAFANPNRDDTGAPKALVYGGVSRSRLSSQSLKRAARTMYEVSGDRTARSNQQVSPIVDLVVASLTEAGVEVSDEDLTKITKLVQTRIRKLYAKDEKKGESEEQAKDTLVWLAERERFELAAKVLDAFTKGDDAEFDFIVPQSTSSLAIAAFGRMFANRPDLQNEAAVQMAHAFTTHEVTSEIDYFTAVDDLRVADSGAGHLGLAEYTGGVYYRYFNINREDLLKVWADAETPDARRRLVEMFQALFIALPTGKQNSAAHHSLPSLVVLEETAHPINLAAAFERPVRATAGSGLLDASADALHGALAAARTQMPSWHGLTMSNRERSLEALADTAADWVIGG